MKKIIFVIILALSCSGVEAYNSTSGHWIYFENYNNTWSDVYLRIGRDNHVYCKQFERIPGTSWWKCEAPDYANFTHFTITDTNDGSGDGKHVQNDLPEGANRLFWWSYDINCNRWFVLNTAEGGHAEDGRYWWANSDYEAYPHIRNAHAGHQIWFDNSNTHWTNVYLRLGRSEATGLGKYAATWTMTNIPGSDLWMVETTDWTNLEAWTITDTNDNNGDNYSFSDLPTGANRLYFYNLDMDEYVMYIADGNAAQGTSEGVNYWANHSSTASPSVSGCNNCFFVTH